jgi:serine/threonine protein phosphatase PrpC
VIAAGRKVDPPINPGTTAVLCLVQNGSAWWAHVGDSRLYLFRGSVPIYRTRDHSFVEKLVERGHLSNDERGNHPLRNYMTRCIGLSDSVPEVTVSNEVSLHAGDVIMLCSDGMWEPIDEMQLGMKILDGRLSDALDKLAQQAEETKYPSSDNISAVAIQIMSLQLIGRAINDEIDKQVAKASRLDPVKDAIDVIEQTFKLYEHEMK